MCDNLRNELIVKWSRTWMLEGSSCLLGFDFWDSYDFDMFFNPSSWNCFHALELKENWLRVVLNVLHLFILRILKGEKLLGVCKYDQKSDCHRHQRFHSMRIGIHETSNWVCIPRHFPLNSNLSLTLQILNSQLIRAMRNHMFNRNSLHSSCIQLNRSSKMGHFTRHCRNYPHQFLILDPLHLLLSPNSKL